ncbi:hypothetical protein D1872_278820 [compost metagenome]
MHGLQQRIANALIGDLRQPLRQTGYITARGSFRCELLHHFRLDLNAFVGERVLDIRAEIRKRASKEAGENRRCNRHGHLAEQRTGRYGDPLVVLTRLLRNQHIHGRSQHHAEANTDQHARNDELP